MRQTLATSQVGEQLDHSLNQDVNIPDLAQDLGSRQDFTKSSSTRFDNRTTHKRQSTRPIESEHTCQDSL